MKTRSIAPQTKYTFKARNWAMNRRGDVPFDVVATNIETGEQFRSILLFKTVIDASAYAAKMILRSQLATESTIQRWTSLAEEEKTIRDLH